jgi:hypothetical protein
MYASTPIRASSNIVIDHRGEERPLVGEVVVHQCPGDSGTLGDLVDADFVVGPLPKDLCTQREQFGASILGG